MNQSESEYLEKIKEIKNGLEQGEIETIDDFHSRFDYFNNIQHPSNLETRNKALELMENIISASYHPILSRGVAMLAGALIESGDADATIVVQCIYDLFMETIKNARPVLDEIAKLEEEEPINEKVLEEKYPESYYEWLGLERAWLPLKAVLVSNGAIRNELKKNDELLKVLRKYQDSNNGCFWIYRALFIFEGEMLILHPQTKKGFRIFAEEVEHALTLSHLLTKMLVRKNDGDFIPPQEKLGTSQFWIYNWQAIKFFPEEYSKVSLDDLIECDVSVHLGSGSFMTDIAYFEDKLPIIIAVDTEIPWSFPVTPSFPELSPKIELVEILQQITVDKWFERFKSSI